MSSRYLRFLCGLVLLSAQLVASDARDWPWSAPEIPDSQGITNTVIALNRLPVTARILFVMAHTDDEGYLDAMLPYASYVLNARTGLFCYFRGGKGHNVISADRDEPLMLMRTGEMMNANRHYGVSHLYFSRYVSYRVQSLDQVLARWGREDLTRELVEVIRTFRPHIVVSHWSGTRRDGHGHHEMVGLVTPEAARLAGLPDRYPEMSRRGLLPWRPRKVYLWLPPRRSAEPDKRGKEVYRAFEPKGPVFRLDGERYRPLFGRSLAELAMAGFRAHISQGKGVYPSTFPGNENYALQLVYGPGMNSREPEESLFDGIDAGLTGLLNVAPHAREKLDDLAAKLEAVEGEISAARDAFRIEAPERAAPYVARGLGLLQDLVGRVRGADLEPLERHDLLFLLAEKQKDFIAALQATLGLDYRFLGEFENMVPGEPYHVRFALRNGSSQPLEVLGFRCRVPGDWGVALRAGDRPDTLRPWKRLELEAEISPSPSAEYTRPFWRRKSRWELEVDRKEWTHLPYAPPEVVGEVRLRAFGVPFVLRRPLMFNKLDFLEGERPVYVQVAPEISVTVEPEWTVLQAHLEAPQRRQVTVRVVNNGRTPARLSVELDLPPGWRSEPAQVNIGVDRRHSVYHHAERSAEGAVTFRVTAPPGLEVRTYRIQAAAKARGRTWTSGYEVVSHRRSMPRHLYRPAVAEAHAFDLRIPAGIRLGYVSVSRDVRTENPWLMERFQRLWKELGVEVTLLKGSELYWRDLSRFDCLIIGFFGYDRSPAVFDNNQRLLEFVRRGGLLVVNPQNYSQWNAAGGLGPYPSKLRRVRVPYTARVEFLAPDHPVLTTPNQITPADFAGWDEDMMYTVMDLPPGEANHQAPVEAVLQNGERLRGGLVVARYGRGCYVYSGALVAWQTTLGPLAGPFRLLANILSLARR